MSPWIVIVTVAALLVYLWTGISVAHARREHKVEAPTMVGPPAFERTVRVQANTLEWLVIFLPALWMCGTWANEWAAVLLGVVWIFGRVIYARGYRVEASKRHAGFGIQAIATLLLLAGSLGGAIWVAIHRPY